jgi:flagellar motility protein MotE (MotC chaperone)
MVELLFSLLVTGAGLAASGAVSEFSKGAGKATFEAIKARLTKQYDVKSLSLLEDAKHNSSFEAAIKDELSELEIAQDAKLLKLAETLREEIAALPSETQARYAVNIETIRSGGNLLFEAVEGVNAKTATSERDMTFRNVKAPPGK